MVGLHFGLFIHKKNIEQLQKVAVKMQNRQSSVPGVNSAINGACVSSTNDEISQRFNTDRKRGHCNSSTCYTPEGKSVNCKEYLTWSIINFFKVTSRLFADGLFF